MSSVILSAASARTPALQRLVELTRAALLGQGESEVRVVELATMKLAYCQGEFDCWVKTPGLCRAHDGEHDIVQAVHDAERMVLIDAVTFGGHSSLLKRAQDRMIGLINPFFEKRAALTHHGARYERPASFYALGWSPRPDAELSRTWRDLADGNALNMVAPRVGSVVVDDTTPDAWPLAIAEMLASTERPGSRITHRAPLREELLQAARPKVAAVSPVRTAAIVVGRAKVKGTSVSENLARALAGRLAKAGLDPRLHFAMEFVHEGATARSAAQAIAASNLFILVSPLYVDSLPSLATHALELVAAAREEVATPAKFVLLMNCGFPEPEQNRTALRIGAHFADAAGYQWAGGLALGGGGVVDPRVPIDEQYGPREHIKRALDLAVAGLAKGGVVPEEAIVAMAESPLPDVAYRVMGDLGWRQQAWKQGVAQRDLRARPLG